jgi:predicted RecA/RadA family phage recombinase
MTEEPDKPDEPDSLPKDGGDDNPQEEPIMPQATFIQEGRYIDHTPASPLASGDVVVQGDLVGVTLRPLAAGELGSLAVEGVFDFTKNTGVAYNVGVLLYWDDTNNIVTTTASGNKPIGKVVRAAATADTLVQVRLSQ